MWNVISYDGKCAEFVQSVIKSETGLSELDHSLIRFSNILDDERLDYYEASISYGNRCIGKITQHEIRDKEASLLEFAYRFRSNDGLRGIDTKNYHQILQK